MESNPAFLLPCTPLNRTAAGPRPLCPAHAKVARPKRIFRTPPRAMDAAFATSSNEDTQAAILEVVSAVKNSIASPSLALVSCTVDRDAAHLISQLKAQLPNAQIHGATTCGAVLTNSGPIPNGIGVMALKASDEMHAAACNLDTVNGDAMEAGRQVAREVSQALDQVSHLLLAASPGIEDAVMAGISEVLPNAQVFGGSAADNTVEGKWSLLSDAGTFGAGVSVVGVKASVSFGTCLLPPYEVGTTAATITKCEGRTVFELDGRRAGDVLREWVGDSIDIQAQEGGSVIAECAAFPLGIERETGAWVGIHAAQIGEDGSVGLFAEVRKGDRLTVMKNMGGGDSIGAAKIGLGKAYDEAMRNGQLTNPKGGVVIYCGGLSMAVGDGLAGSLTPLEGKAPLLGMTAFGEQGNLAGCNVHSNLAVGVALFE